MKHLSAFAVSMILASAVTAQSPEPSPERDMRLLHDRLRAATEPASASDSSANALWTHQALDNTACVRGLDDITGDGVADAISGHSVLGSGDNFFALSGASSGAATVAWSQETVGGASGGYFWGDECIVKASDFTGDGIGEVLVGLAGGGRTANCFDATDGSLVWQFNTYNETDSGWVYSIREMPDITGDGVPEVIFGCGSDNDSVYCIDGSSTGNNPTVLWSFKALDAVFTVTWVPDVSGDGKPDVIAGTGDNDDRIYCLRSDTGTVVWTHSAGGSVMSIETIQDVSGDGVRDVVAALWNGARTVTCIASNNGGVVWNRPLGTGMKVAPLADVSGDGIDEVLVGTWDNAIVCVDGSTGAVRWSTPTGTTNGGDVWTIAAMPDVNGDGLEDVVAGSFDTYAYAVDGFDGSYIWEHATGNRVFSVSWTGDANGDGKPEALLGTQDTSNLTVVHAIEGDSGLLPPYVKLTGTGTVGTTTIGVHTTSIPADEYFLFIALGPAAIPVGGLGTLLLQPSTLRVVSNGLIPDDGTENIFLPIPNEPLLIGFSLHFQSLVGPDIFGGLPQLTNSVVTTLN